MPLNLSLSFSIICKISCHCHLSTFRLSVCHQHQNLSRLTSNSTFFSHLHSIFNSLFSLSFWHSLIALLCTGQRLYFVVPAIWLLLLFIDFFCVLLFFSFFLSELWTQNSTLSYICILLHFLLCNKTREFLCIINICMKSGMYVCVILYT